MAGIIPAYAGNTGGESAHVRDIGDHPRVCGEHLLVWCPTLPLRGSSPRMRGTLSPFVVSHPFHGIIPAYAGNTRQAAWSADWTGDHPRVCGEHIEYKIEGETSQGSSPRMRGTLCKIRIGFLDGGIIPAYAGNTWTCPR